MAPAARSPDALLEAAAISLKMIAAKHASSPSTIATIARRFAVDEEVLRRVVRSRATQRTYDRIHSNVVQARLDA